MGGKTHGMVTPRAMLAHTMAIIKYVFQSGHVVLGSVWKIGQYSRHEGIARSRFKTEQLHA